MWNPPRGTGQEPTDRFRVARERYAKPDGDFVARRGTVQLQDVRRRLECISGLGFLENVADEQLEEIFYRRDSIGSSEFVQHHRHLATLTLELQEHLGARLRSRSHRDRPDGRPARRCHLEQVEGIDHPGDAIERYKDFAAGFDGRKSNVNGYFGIAATKAYLALGEQEKAQALMDELISAIIASPSLTYHDSAIHDASIYALAGQEETAIAILEEWVNRGGATALLQQDIRHGLGVLADDPRYQSILRTVNDRLSEQKANLARWEASGEMLPMPREVTDPR